MGSRAGVLIFFSYVQLLLIVCPASGAPPIVSYNEVLNFKDSRDPISLPAHTSSNESQQIHFLSRNGSIALAQGLVPFKVPDSKTTMHFYDFGASLSAKDMMLTLSSAVRIPTIAVVGSRRDRPINKGYYRFTQTLSEGDRIRLVVGDFSEIGHPMTYLVLCDVIRGIGEFASSPDNHYREMRFEVDVEEVGHVGSGHIAQIPKPTATPSITRLPVSR